MPIDLVAAVVGWLVQVLGCDRWCAVHGTA
jgi:hypothetical protein